MRLNPGTAYWKDRKRPMNETTKRVLTKWTKEMLDAGMIREVPFSERQEMDHCISNLHVVKEGPEKYQVCQDMKGVNRITERMQAPNDSVERVLRRLSPTAKVLESKLYCKGATQ